MRINSLLMASAAALFAAEGFGGHSLNSNRTAYIVHKEGEPGTLELSPSGRVVTEPFNRPDWAGNVVLANLAERNMFYQTRLGAELAEPLVTTNIINVLDLGFVALDDEGNEVELIADSEYRMNMLATTLGVDRETGDIEGAVTEHYIDRDNKGYTLEEIASKQDIDAVFGEQTQQQTAKG